MSLNISASIKTKLIVIIVVALVAALGISSFLVYLQAKNILVNSVDQSITKQTDSSSKELVLWLGTRKVEIETLANSPIMATMDKEKILNYIKNEDKRFSLYDGLFVVNNVGDGFSSRGWNGTVKDRKYFQQVIATGGTVVSEPLYNRSTNKLSFIVAAPIKKDGKLIGVIGGNIPFADIQKQVDAIKIGKTGEAFLIQQDGFIIAHPNKELVMKLNLLQDTSIDPALREAAEQVVNGKNGITRYGWNKTDKYMGYVPIPGVNWGLCVAVPVQEITEQLSTITNISITTPLVIAIVISIVVSIFLTRIIIQPIKRLQSLMSKVEDGDLQVRETVRSSDELGELTRVINKTLDALLQSTLDAEENVKYLNTATLELKEFSSTLIDIATTMAANSEEVSAKTCIASAASQQITDSMHQSAADSVTVSQNLIILAQAAEKMASALKDATGASGDTSRQVRQVSLGIEEISDSINKVSQFAYSVSVSVESVASEVNDINESLEQVRLKCDQSMEFAQEASLRSRETSDIIRKLSVSSQQIGKVIDIIRSIAEQTNMLALNATIEAAGAGEAGKGFAVVAGEVKDLAKRTAEFTRQISTQIETMQQDMAAAVSSVKKISGVIEETTQISGAIAQAVADKTKNVNEITQAMSSGVNQVNSISKEIEALAVKSTQAAENSTAAANGVHFIVDSIAQISLQSDEVARSTDEASKVMNRIADTTQEVSRATREISTSMLELDATTIETAEKAADTSTAANNLAKMADHLKGLVDKFGIKA